MLLDNRDHKKWRIRINSSQIVNGENGEEKEVTVPAILLLIPPTEPAALDTALRYTCTHTIL